MIISGNVLEFYEYEKPVKTGGGGSSGGGRRKKDEEKSEKAVDIRKQSTRKARNNFRRLVLSNFGNRDKFITLTFRDNNGIDIRNIEQCNKEFKKFIQRLRRKYGDFKYCAVIEFQDKYKRGAIHYHLLANLPYVPHDTLSQIWGLGFVGINAITGCDNIGAYMTKYMMKDNDDERLQGKKSYFTSKNLIKPIITYGYKAEEIYQEYKKTQKKEVFTNCYESEHNGKINYTEFNLKRLN